MPKGAEFTQDGQLRVFFDETNTEVSYSKKIKRDLFVDFDEDGNVVAFKAVRLDALRQLLDDEYGEIYSDTRVRDLYRDGYSTAINCLEEIYPRKRVERGIDAASKLKELIKKLNELRPKLQTDELQLEALNARDELKNLLSEVFIKSCGIDPNIKQ